MVLVLKWLIRKILYVFAILIILGAVLFSVVKIITPILDEHRGDFEAIASDLLKAPVSIKQVRVSWYQYHPVVDLNETTIFDPSSKQALLKINKIKLLISVPQSLWQWKFVTSGILVSGSSLNIQQSETGNYTVKELAPLASHSQVTQPENELNNLLAWLSHEPYLILDNIDLHYTDKNKRMNFITLNHLSFENSSDKHKILGKAFLHQALPLEIDLAAKWKGKEASLDKIKGRIYLYVTGFSFSQWLKGQSFRGVEVKQGIGSAKIWAIWRNGKFQRIQTNLQVYDVELYSQVDKQVRKINRISGNFGWDKKGDSQILAGDEILIDLPQHLWPVTHFSASFIQDVENTLTLKSLRLGYVDLGDMQIFLPSFPVLNGLKINGILQNAQFIFSGPLKDLKSLSFNTYFSQLGIAPFQNYPGVSNLNGYIQWNGLQGSLQLNSRKTKFKLPMITGDEVLFDVLFGNVHFELGKNQQWTLKIPSLQVWNSEMAANLNGAVMMPDKANLTVDLAANLTMPHAEKISHYMPSKLFDTELNHWLKQAFLAGEIKSAHLNLRGPLKDFPFDQNSEESKHEFSIISQVNNIDLRFGEEWPWLRHLTGMLSIKGRRLAIEVNQAETAGISLPAIRGEIPHLGEKSPVLHVESNEVSTDFSHAMEYVHASPLKNSVGKMFKEVALSGPIALKLGLIVPLNHPDHTQVQGNIHFANSEMNLIPWNLKLNNLSGDVQFTETTTTAKQIQSELFHKPFTFDLTTKILNNSSVVQANFANQLSISDLENWLNIPFTRVVQGETNIKGSIDLSLTAPIAIHLKSNLFGAKVNFDQYSKNANEKQDFSADIIAEHAQPLKLKMNYGDLIQAAVLLNRKQEKYDLVSARLLFGSGHIDWPSDAGLYLSGHFNELDWTLIKSYFNQSENTHSSLFNLPPLKNIDIRTDKIKIGKQFITKSRIQVTPSKNNWDIGVDSAELIGRINIPMHFTRQDVITAQLQKIYIHSSGISEASNLSMDVKTMPGLSIVANDVRYDDIKLGRISFKASPSANGLKIQELQMSSPNILLNATGDWMQGQSGQTTRIIGNATSNRISNLLSQFGLDARNFIAGNGKLKFNLNWPGAPYSPTLSNIDGSASLELGAGRIIDIGNQAGAKMDIGKMLSIFSLQTIPRRLSLDFSDIFQKGYSFDSMRGDFTLTKGDVYTTNMRIDGPVARVAIDGRIGLNNKDYNFILGVTAHVTSSIPVAATLLTGNPLIGLGALAVNTVLGAKVSTYFYLVTGSWSHPVWKSVQGNRKMNQS